VRARILVFARCTRSGRPTAGGRGRNRTTRLPACGRPRVVRTDSAGRVRILEAARRERDRICDGYEPGGSAAPSLATVFEQLVSSAWARQREFAFNGARYEMVDSGRVRQILPHPPTPTCSTSPLPGRRLDRRTAPVRPPCNGSRSPTPWERPRWERSPWTVESGHRRHGFGDTSTCPWRAFPRGRSKASVIGSHCTAANGRFTSSRRRPRSGEVRARRVGGMGRI